MKDKMAEVIRVGIAGLGRSGWFNHAVTLHGLSDRFIIEAVTDIDPERRREAVAKFGCQASENLGDLLLDPKVDLVVLATPTPYHCAQTLQALAAGKHVVCEKPMASSLEETDQMMEAAQKAKKVLTIFQNQRYMPSFVKVREVINSGKLGRIVQIRISVHNFGRRWDWQTLKEFSGGELNNTGSHFVDQALLLLRADEPNVFCRLERTLTSGDAEDHCKIILWESEGPMVDLEITRACAFAQDMWHVMGTCGGLCGNASQLRWKYVNFAQLPPRAVDPTPTPDRSYNSESLPWQEETWEAAKDLPSTYTCFYADLFETLRHNAPLAVTPQSVQRQIDILERCRIAAQSLSENGEIYAKQPS